jgi:hypothetical protein
MDGVALRAAAFVGALAVTLAGAYIRPIFGST